MGRGRDGYDRCEQEGGKEKDRSFRYLGMDLKVIPPDYAVVEPDHLDAEELDDPSDDETDFLSEIGANSFISRESLRPDEHHVTPLASERASKTNSELARIRAAAPGVPRLTV